MSFCFLQAVVELGTRNSEQPCCGGEITVRALDGALQQCLLEFFQAESGVEYGGRQVGGVQGGRVLHQCACGAETALSTFFGDRLKEQMLRFNHATLWRQDNAAFQNVFQFAYVARPGVVLEGVHGLVGDAGDALAVQ